MTVKALRDQPLVVGIARAEQQPVVAEGDGAAVAIGGDVADFEDGHVHGVQRGTPFWLR